MTTLTDTKRLRLMTVTDLASEREWLRFRLQEIGRHNPEGWLVVLYDEYAGALDMEIHRRTRRALMPRGGAKLLSPQELDSLRQSTSMVALLRDYGIEAQGRGPEYKALCPFHDDKNPSMTVNDDKKLYHCFACGAGGDLFGFVMNMDKCTFGQAIRKLAVKAGIKHIFVTEVSRPPKKTTQKHRGAVDI